MTDRQESTATPAVHRNAWGVDLVVERPPEILERRRAAAHLEQQVGSDPGVVAWAIREIPRDARTVYVVPPPVAIAALSGSRGADDLMTGLTPRTGDGFVTVSTLVRVVSVPGHVRMLTADALREDFLQPPSIAVTCRGDGSVDIRAAFVASVHECFAPALEERIGERVSSQLGVPVSVTVVGGHDPEGAAST